MFLELFTTICAALLSIPLLVAGTQAFVTLRDGNRGDSGRKSPEPNYKAMAYRILIPAHNEAEIINATLTHLLNELPDNNPQHVILIADNCTDLTAQIARAFGITVLERTDPNRRGKGYALDYGIRHLAATGQPPEIVTILDADCETDRNSLTNLIHTVAEKALPAQMVYLMRIKQNAALKQKIAGFAWLVKNKIRPIGMHRLNLPVVLTGTGMAFPWQVFEKVKLAHGNIVEDMQLGIDCTIMGYPPVLCPDATVYSDFPEQSSAELSQRTRWEHGHLQTIFQQVPKLIKESFARKNWRLFALALDIGVPPLSLLVMISLAGLLTLASVLLVTGDSTALVILLLSTSYFAVMLGRIWWIHGQAHLSAKELSAIPYYILSKLSIYLTFLFKRQKEWIRTNRNS